MYAYTKLESDHGNQLIRGQEKISTYQNILQGTIVNFRDENFNAENTANNGGQAQSGEQRKGNLNSLTNKPLIGRESLNELSRDRILDLSCSDKFSPLPLNS